jgi:hypothetical protein
MVLVKNIIKLNRRSRMTSITSFARRLKKQMQSPALALELVNPADVEIACAAAGHRWRECFWTPFVTVLTFLRQVLHGNCSCRQAVALTLATLAETASAVTEEEEEDQMSGEPSAYSQARQKLPQAVMETMNRRLVGRVQKQASAAQHWYGREVVIVDGSSVSAPDTLELQKAFPQPSGQKPGCGFPVLRLLAIFCWASGSLLDWAADSLHVGELALLRRLLHRLAPGTVVLGDTYYGSYYDLVLLQRHGLDGVYHWHQRRPTDLRRGTRLGRGDHWVTWTKPCILPRGISPKEWSCVPETLTVRHVQVVIDTPGFRSRTLDLVTTLMDPQTFPVAVLADLYRDRWLVELNLRSLKTTLRMEVLKGQSVEMIRKELLAYQLAYNLIRWLMWQAAQIHGVDVRRLSFAGTQQRVLAALPYLALCRTGAKCRRMTTLLLARIAADIVPDRPNRLEPRAVKRRPKNYRRLTKPRALARTMAYFING